MRLSEVVNEPIPEEPKSYRLSDINRIHDYEIKDNPLGIDKGVGGNLVEGVVEAISSTPQVIGNFTTAYGDYVRTKADEFDKEGIIFGIKPIISAKPIGQRIYEAGEKLTKDNEKYIRDKFPEQENVTFADKFAKGVGQGSVSLLSAVGMGLLLGPTAPAIAFGASASSEGFNEARKKDKDLDEALNIAGVLGIVEGGLEFWGVKRLVSLKGGSMKKVIENAINGSFTEFTQEFSQTAANQTIKTATGLIPYNGEKSIKKIMADSLFSGAIGAVLGGGAGTTMSLIQRQSVEDSLVVSGMDKEKARDKSDDLMKGTIDALVTKIESLGVKKEKVIKINKIEERAIDSFNPTISNKSQDENISPYDRVVEISKIKKTSTLKKDFSEFIDKTFVPISTRLSKVDERLKDAIRKHSYSVNQKTNKDMKRAVPLLESMKKMDLEDALKMDFALKNGDIDFVNTITKKYGIEESYKETRRTLDDIYKRAKDVGMDLGYIDTYFPRKIIDLDQYIKFLRKTDEWGSIKKAFSDEESNIGRPLKEDEKAQIVNSMIRGYGKEKITISKPGNIKERKIIKLTPEMNSFYKDSGVALTEYIRSMNDNIESRRFFGKGKNIDNSIGNYVANLVEDKIISGQDEDNVRQILKSYFDKRGTHGIVTGFKNFSYIYTMGSPTSAITQIGDLAFSLFQNGYYGTIKSLVGKKNITKEDIGINLIAEEFTDSSKSSKAVSKVFKAIGLEAVDAMGKETFINASFDNLSKKAINEDKELIKTLKRVFDSRHKNVLEDLKNRNPTDDVKYMLFSELADFQPITLSEMPEYYVRGGNLRIFYMLKSYTIKQLDVYHNKIFREKDPVKKMKNTLKLAFALMLTGVTSDTIKDILLGREIDIDDLVVNNILKLVGFSRWQLYKARMDGLFTTLLQSILPPVPFLDDMYKDAMRITSSQDITEVSDFRIWQRIPLVGKFYYWWFGGGRDI